MKLNEIKANAGSRKKRIRRGRGDSAGKGSFSGRGVKGQNARAGGGVRIGFEGGQTPLLRRSPKLPGFKNPCRTEYLAINLNILEEKYNDGEVVSMDSLLEKRIIRNVNTPVKILGYGKLTKKITAQGLKMSKSAEKAFGATPKKAAKKTEKEED